jgi:hypothetical protein
VKSPGRFNVVRGAQLASWALVASLSCAACDSSSDPAAGNPAAPGSFVNELTTSVTTTVRTHGCGRLSSNVVVDLFVTSMRSNVFVDQVTLHMIDGSNLGGPMVTFPRPNLNSMFGTTFILAGRSRSFAFKPAIACTWFKSGSLRANVVFVNEGGVSSSTTATAQ